MQRKHAKPRVRYHRDKRSNAAKLRSIGWIQEHLGATAM